MIIKFLRLNPKAKLPQYAHPGDAGMDLFCMENYILKPGERRAFHLGFALEIPENHVALVWDKSSLPFNGGVHCLAGVCDSSYRGEYIVILVNLSDQPYSIEEGDKIAQLLIQPITNPVIKEVSSLSKTMRGSGRLGSTGKK